MKVNILKYAKIMYTSCFILACVHAAHANIGGSVGYELSGASVSAAKDDAAEKIVTNVKVMYNPVAEQISVSFKLTKQSNVAIKLMDALGNEVLNLSNSTLDAGNQNLSFETEGKVSPGFYFVRVGSGTETVVKRISIR